MRVETFGAATLYLGDCRDILPSIEGIDLVLSDPPYSSGARTDSERQVRGSMLREIADEDWFSHDAMTSWGFGWFIRSIFGDLRPRLAVGAHVYLFCDWRQTPNLYGMLEACGYRVNHCLVWRKAHYGMGTYWRNQHENIVFASNGMPAPMLDRGKGSVLDGTAVTPSAREHPTEKPVDLLLEIVDAVPGALVCDPFMGSGPTGVAALRAGRRFVGCEINPTHFDTACRQLEAAHRAPRLFTPNPPSPSEQKVLL